MKSFLKLFYHSFILGVFDIGTTIFEVLGSVIVMSFTAFFLALSIKYFIAINLSLIIVLLSSVIFFFIIFWIVKILLLILWTILIFILMGGDFIYNNVLKLFKKKTKEDYKKPEIQSLTKEEEELLHINRILSKPYKETLKESFFYKRDLDLIRDYDFVKTKADKIFETLLQWPGFHSNNEIFFVRGATFDLRKYFRGKGENWSFIYILNDPGEVLRSHKFNQENRKKQKKYNFLKQYKNCGITIYVIERNTYFLVISQVRRISKTFNYFEEIVFPIEQKKELTEEQAMKILEENTDWIMGVKGAKKRFKGNVYAHNSYIK